MQLHRRWGREVASATGPWIGAIKAARAYLLPTTEDRLETMVGPAGAWRETREWQIRFLRSRGLAPFHRFLELGCGPLRGGLPVIAHLDANGYTGIDIRPAAILAAEALVSQTGLAGRAPQLIVSRSFGRDELPPSEFDMIWVFQVLYHLDESAVRACLDQIARRLADDGCCYGNIRSEGARGRWQEFPFEPRSLEWWQLHTAKAGLRMTVLGRLAELDYPARLLGRVDHMLMLTKASPRGTA